MSQHSKYFIISAGAKKAGTLVYDARPGLYNEREYITDVAAQKVYLDTVAGNDANSGLTPSAPKLTYANAVTALDSSGRAAIEVLNNNADLSGITISRPTQMASGVYGRLWNTAAITDVVTLARSNVFANPVYFPKRGEIFTYQTVTPFNVSRSIDNGESFSVSSFALSLQILRPRVCNNVVIQQSDDSDSAINLGRLQVSDLQTFSQDVAIADAVSRNVYFHAACYASRENLLYAVGTQGAIYRTADLTGRTGWVRLQGGEYNFDFRFLDVYENPATGTIYVVGGFLGTLSGARTNRVVVFRKKLDETSFTEISFSLPGYAALSSTFAGNCIRFLDFPTEFGDSTQYIGVLVVSSGTNNRIYRIGVDDTIYAPVTYSGTGITKSTFMPLFAALTFGNGINVLNPKTLNTVVATLPGIINYILSTNSRIMTLNSNQIGLIQASLTTQRINAPLVGFDVFNYRIASVLRSCRVRFCHYVAGTTAIELSRCDTDGLHIVRDNIDVRENLLQGFSLRCAPTSPTVQITRNTVKTELYVLNNAATGFEYLSTNIIELGAHANFAVTLRSSNFRGFNRNVVLGANILTDNPRLAPNYDLEREIAGYIADAPCVRRSQDYVNSQGQRRDIGAFSAYETNIYYEYARTFRFLKPSAEDAIKIIRHNRANMHVSVSGVPDVYNDPAGAWEEIILQFRALPNADIAEIRNHIAFVDYLDSLVNTHVKVWLDVDYTSAGTLTLASAASVGSVELNFTTSNFAGGDVLIIAGQEYYILYKSSSTRAVINKPLHTNLLTGAVISLKSPAGYGEYQYVPEQNRQLTRWYESDLQFLRGLTLRFVRKYGA